MRDESKLNFSTTASLEISLLPELILPTLQIDSKELIFGQQIGQGAYGKVFAGTYDKKPVAIKLFNAKLTAEQKDKVQQEALMMIQVKSKYLVCLLAYTNNPYTLVMDLYQGTLRARLDSSEPISTQQRYRWGMQATKGVLHLHKVNILHRDLKSENVLVDAQGNILIGDFGLSLLKSSAATISNTQMSSIAGTAYSMAPELFKGKPNTKYTDIYSLGMLLWEIFSGKRPFEGVMHIQALILAGTKEKIPKDCPKPVKKIITQCWDTTPKKRPSLNSIVKDFKTELKKIDAKAPAQPVSTASVTTTTATTTLVPSILPMPLTTTTVPATPTLLSQPVSTAPVTITTPMPLAITTVPATLTLVSPKDEKPLKKQDELILACERGNEIRVIALLEAGADPDKASDEGKYPLGAAIWGHNPAVVNKLLTRIPKLMMDLTAWEIHNEKYYKEFTVASETDFDKIKDYPGLLVFLKKIEASPFLQEYIVKEFHAKWLNSISTWQGLITFVEEQGKAAITDGEFNDELQYRIKKRIGGYRVTIKALITFRSGFLDTDLLPTYEFLIFKEVFTSERFLNQEKVNRLLSLIAEGDQEAAERVLKKDPRHLLFPGTVTDLSQREFKKITAFQLALWSLDWRMWKMIQTHLPVESQAEQFAVLELKGIEKHGKQFNFAAILKLLEGFLKVNESEEYKQWLLAESKRDLFEEGSPSPEQKYFMEKIIPAQKLLPIHVIHEYCHPDRGFQPVPCFTEPTLPRTRQLLQADWLQAIGRAAIGRSNRPEAYGINHIEGPGGYKICVSEDIAALKALSAIRTKQRDSLRPSLMLLSQPYTGFSKKMV